MNETVFKAKVNKITSVTIFVPGNKWELKQINKTESFKLIRKYNKCIILWTSKSLKFIKQTNINRTCTEKLAHLSSVDLVHLRSWFIN